MNLLKFKNIEEIVFKKVAEDTFSITIKSDIEKDNKDLKDTVFEAGFCKLNSKIELNLSRQFTNIYTDFGVINSEYYNIPLDIQLLLNQKLNEIFRIKQENPTK